MPHGNTSQVAECIGTGGRMLSEWVAECSGIRNSGRTVPGCACQPAPGGRCGSRMKARLVVRIGAAWTSLDVAMDLLVQSGSVAVALGALGGTTGMAVLEETLSGLTGAAVTSAIAIPNRSIVLGVSTRIVTTITGATSYDCGISGETTKFGGSLGVAAGSSNIGVIGPQAFYADTPIVLTAGGGNFTAGAVRIAIHYLTLGVPN
ncbi:MAG: hypothetical protein Q8O82_07210 [Pseudorhodobacter sp.]|nr:hypothetical protein [Pseudorhodobacter sp.]